MEKNKDKLYKENTYSFYTYVLIFLSCAKSFMTDYYWSSTSVVNEKLKVTQENPFHNIIEILFIFCFCTDFQLHV